LTLPRARDLGLLESELPAGRYNAITDVAGVRVGHCTLIHGDGRLVPSVGPVRTGVTVVMPHGGNLFRRKVPAAVHTINGFGKPLGFEQVRELGNIESPLALTNTLNVGLVADALVQYSVRQNPEIGTTTTSVNVVVGETNDSHLNDLQGRHVRDSHVWAAIDTATDGPVQEGAVGAGTGTACFGWKGGIGTASRIVPPDAGGYTVGALVQTNFGRARDLVIGGVPVGRSILPPQAAPADARPQAAGTAVPEFGELLPADQGSVMIVLATDAPLSARPLHRLCVRAAAGLARTGSVYGHHSGDFVIAFSTVGLIEHDAPPLTAVHETLANEEQIDWLFHAVVEAVEEAVVNSLCAAATMTGRDGNVRHALPVGRVVELVRKCRARGEQA
jgi:D-aminopeptidase